MEWCFQGLKGNIITQSENGAPNVVLYAEFSPKGVEPVFFSITILHREGKWYIGFWYRHPSTHPEVQEIGIDFDPTEKLNR